MNDRALPILPLGILLLLAGLTFWLSQYVTTETTRAINKRHDPDVIIEKFSAQKLSPIGDVQYVVTANKMTHYPDDDSSQLEEVVFTATTPGRPKLTMRAPRGRSMNGGDEIVMEGGVVIDSEAQGRSPAMQMRTPKLTVLPEKNIARSNDGVVVESVQGVMNAAAFVLDNNTQILKMERFKATLKNSR